MTTKSPCKNVCRYEEFEDEPMCIACGRSYDDLDRWLYASDDEKKNMNHQAKERLKRYKHGS